MKKTEEERQQICLDLYEGEKSRNFMLHMVRAYSKMGNVKPVLAFREKQKAKCALCDDKLMDANGAVKAIGETTMEVLIVADEKPVEKLKSKIDGRVLAYEGSETDTCLCEKCVLAVVQFTQVKLLENDKGIGRVVTSMREKELGIVREPRIQHQNVEAKQVLGENPEFAKLLGMFGK